MRDRSFARAACAAIGRLPATLVQSHERIPCCDIYRAGDGVHAVWVDERARNASAMQRLALFASPYHRYVMNAERRMFASPRLTSVICISRMVQREIHERFGLPLERLPVIYNAIDPAVFNPGLASGRRATREELGIPLEACVFLLVGSEYARKGVGRALEALARVPSPAHLLVVGRDRHPERYQALAHRLGIASRVTFAGAQKDPRPFYGAADAFVLPTLYDALSNAVLEALACGLPVVTSDHCGAGEPSSGLEHASRTVVTGAPTCARPSCRHDRPESGRQKESTIRTEPLRSRSDCSARRSDAPTCSAPRFVR
jgi:UDP-glucose:(heptosyl)LPS alpha-1,3-glucosyltransferase